MKVYVEGGGDTRQQQARLRRAFAKFIEKAGLEGNMPRVIACGSRSAAFDDFKDAHRQPGAIAMLLVDSEGPVTARTARHHLQDRDGWNAPPGTEIDQIHLMVQVMESWFMADREALGRFYGAEFRSGTIPQWPETEGVPKGDVLSALRRATRSTRKGTYHKTRHGFEILGDLDPNKVTTASPHANRFVKSLKKFSESHR